MHKARLSKSSWPLDFFEKNYGATANGPIERPPQGKLEIREPL